MKSQNPAANQLQEYKKSITQPTSIVTGYGTPVDNFTATLTVGPRGPVLLQDTVFLDDLPHFARERIPERVVHAKGAGAFGYFECTHDVKQYTKAAPFSQVGKKTNVAVRFSTSSGESGSADTLRDVRGFAVKFYTEEGTWDIVGNNTPVFFVRDPILFPSVIHSHKRNPVTHLKDPNMLWDFATLRPESVHQMMILFSDRGIPDGFRHMNGYGSHTYKLVNSKNEAFWCKFHYKTDQKVKTLSADKAKELAAVDPDYGIRDLYNAIHSENYPSWTFYFQIMTMEQAKSEKFNIFDLTKVWSHVDYPLIQAGKLVLNKNPTNYFADVEQLAFAPSHMIPGVEPSPDKMLQGRIFVYGDTQRHRLGTNYLQLPVNCPYRVNVANYQRDGPICIDNQGGAPNYFPNSFGGPQTASTVTSDVFNIEGSVSRYDESPDDCYEQPRNFWMKVLKEDHRDRLVANMVSSLQHAADFIQKRAVEVYSRVDPEFGTKLASALEAAKKSQS